MLNSCSRNPQTQGVRANLLLEGKLGKGIERAGSALALLPSAKLRREKKRNSPVSQVTFLSSSPVTLPNRSLSFSCFLVVLNCYRRPLYHIRYSWQDEALVDIPAKTLEPSESNIKQGSYPQFAQKKDAIKELKVLEARHWLFNDEHGSRLRYRSRYRSSL